ncbi:MAG: hypothetical protein HZC04_01295 [Candidatus Lloydbacteria bacterium]|nr:hypothetical protein [Candidatus Lloydbacteria bacterium]
MKKIVLFVSIVFALGFAPAMFAEENKAGTANEDTIIVSEKYHVGGKMPNYKLGTFLEKQGLATIQADGSNCQIFFQLFSLQNSDSDLAEFSVAFPSSKPEGLPYGIFHVPTKTLFLDNRDNTGAKEKNQPDGLIDEIIVNPADRDAMDDHPYCNKE